MKIATNIHRDAFGGITISNLALFDWLKDTDTTIVGMEYISARHFLGTTIFHHYPLPFFSHHIINTIDIFPKLSWENGGNIRKKWNVLIEATKEVLRSESPDIVFINGTYSIPWILTQAAHELGIPIVLRYAGVLQKELYNKNFFIRRRLLKYEYNIASSAHATIFPSTLCRTVVEREILHRAIKESVIIPNPVNQTGVARGKTKKNARYTIAAIGRWSPVKNFQAFFTLHQDLLNEQWPHRAIMVTSWWDEQFGIPETVERKDSMSQEALQKFYTSIDLLIVSSHFETFCNVAAEALVNGCSVLISERVGLAEILHKAGLSRMVIPTFESPKEVTNAIKIIAKKRLTTKEHRVIVKLLRSQEIHEKIIDVIHAVLQREEMRPRVLGKSSEI